MKKTILLILTAFLFTLPSCSGEDIFNVSVPTIVVPVSIQVPDPLTEAVTSFAIHNNELYAGTKVATGAEVYRFNGTNLVKVFTAPNANYKYVDSMYSFNNRLYIGLYNDTDGAEVYRSNSINPTDGMGNWELVYENNPVYNSVGAIYEYSGQIYIGVSSYDNGGGQKVIVLRSPTGNNGSFADISGPWLDHNNEAANFTIYNGNLYIATIKDYNNFGDGGELFFYNGAWGARVDDNAPGVMPGGFGDPNNMGIPSFTAFGAHFYMGVRNQQPGLANPPVPDTGCKIWRSSDMSLAVAYEEVVNNGFGDINNVSVDSIIVYQGYIYALTRNHTSGTQMWRSASGNAGSWSMRNTSGFGDANNVSGRAVIIFNGILYIGLENPNLGSTIIQFGAAP